MKGADEMHMRGTIDQCKGEVNLRGARTRASDMCKINRRRRTCEARIVAIFLVWTSKLSKSWPKNTATRAPQNAPRDQHGHQNGAKRAPRGTPSSLKGPQGLPKSAQEAPKGRPKSQKIALGGHLDTPRKMKSENAINP